MRDEKKSCCAVPYFSVNCKQMLIVKPGFFNVLLDLIILQQII